jgi:hypothetical protein
MKRPKQTSAQKEVLRVFRSIDLEKFWRKVTVKICVGAEEYRYARVKSLEKAHQTFV